MNFLVLTEGTGELLTNVARDLNLYFPDSSITIAKAKSYAQQKQNFLHKFSFLFSKLKKRGISFYSKKLISLCIDKFISYLSFSPSYNQCLTFHNVNIVSLEDHTPSCLLPYIQDIDFCFVIGCRILSKETCSILPHNTFVVHSCDPRFVKGVCLPSFWETIYDLDFFRLTLLRLAPKLDSGEIIYQEEFPLVESKYTPVMIQNNAIPLMIIKSVLGERKILNWDPSIKQHVKKTITKQDLKQFNQKRHGLNKIV